MCYHYIQKIIFVYFYIKICIKYSLYRKRTLGETDSGRITILLLGILKESGTCVTELKENIEVRVVLEEDWLNKSSEKFSKTYEPVCCVWCVGCGIQGNMFNVDMENHAHDTVKETSSKTCLQLSTHPSLFTCAPPPSLSHTRYGSWLVVWLLTSKLLQGYNSMCQIILTLCTAQVTGLN